MQTSPLSPSFNVFANVVYWTPRVIVYTAVGYYSLGYAYHYGIMAIIDKYAIKILVAHVGYIGLGATMPIVQWYAAWGVRFTASLIALKVYDYTERIVIYVYSFHFVQSSLQYAKTVSGSIEIQHDKQGLQSITQLTG